MGYPKLNLPSIKLRAKKEQPGDEIYVWDTLRKKFLRLTPEEWVRQHTIQYLIRECSVVATSIRSEYPIDINGLSQRADIVVLTPDAKVKLLVECKAPQIALREEVASQALRYCSIAKAHYLLLTNGIEHQLYRLDSGKYHPISFNSLSDIL